ncbi:hypothetical protein HBN50_13555 [Halobacteriovorax sp. GB3]|uniref:hypothetical protein n=1 Tax=Halobacteriovorax sp. GB3 TaxID=2719615 RepID=UPI00235EB57B|nr:hypothetical protein [Halobacteriovorax sp. GB3]MDD0854133.1 hypothetical protein [Halobacteriovorax sp. GB3]
MRKLLIGLTLLMSFSSFGSQIKYYVTEIDDTNVVLPVKYDSQVEYESGLRIGRIVFDNQKSLFDYQRNKVVLNHRNGLANFCFEYTIYQGVLVKKKKIDSNSCDQIDIINLVQKVDIEEQLRLKDSKSLYTIAERRGLANICFGKIKYNGLTVANVRLPDNSCK